MEAIQLLECEGGLYSCEVGTPESYLSLPFSPSPAPPSSLATISQFSVSVEAVVFLSLSTSETNVSSKRDKLY